MSDLDNAPRRIGKRDARLQRAGFRPAWLGLGVPAMAAGLYLCAVGTGLLPVPVDVAAPLGVVAITGVGFALFGGTLSLRSILGMLRRWRSRVRRQRYPRHPWRSDFPWHPRGTSDAQASRLVTESVGAVLVWCVVAPFVWLALSIPEFPFIGKVVVAGAVCLALLLTAAVLRGVMQFVGHGSSRIEFGSFPFSPGKKLQVAFLPPRFEALIVTLRYVEERFEVEETWDGEGRQTSIDHAAYLHYQERLSVMVPPGAAAVPMEFELPDRPDWVTQLSAAGSVRYWELLVEADVAGVEFSTSFPLPVYRGEGPSAANPRFRRLLEQPGAQ